MSIGGIIFLSYLAGILVYGCLHYAIAEVFPKQELVSTEWEQLLVVMFFWPLVYVAWIFMLVLWTAKVCVSAVEKRRIKKNTPPTIPVDTRN